MYRRNQFLDDNGFNIWIKTKGTYFRPNVNPKESDRSDHVRYHLFGFANSFKTGLNHISRIVSLNQIRKKIHHNPEHIRVC